MHGDWLFVDHWWTSVLYIMYRGWELINKTCKIITEKNQNSMNISPASIPISEPNSRYNPCRCSRYSACTVGVGLHPKTQSAHTDPDSVHICRSFCPVLVSVAFAFLWLFWEFSMQQKKNNAGTKPQKFDKFHQAKKLLRYKSNAMTKVHRLQILLVGWMNEWILAAPFFLILCTTKEHSAATLPCPQHAHAYSH